jgi:hypothetical protein
VLNAASGVNGNDYARSNRQRRERVKMNYSTIKNPPKNESDYIKTSPENLMVLLKQGAARIMTCGMIGAVSDAISFSNSNGYQVSMMRHDDPSDPGGIMSMSGTFYFHRQKQN